MIWFFFLKEKTHTGMERLHQGAKLAAKVVLGFSGKVSEHFCNVSRSFDSWRHISAQSWAKSMRSVLSCVTNHLSQTALQALDPMQRFLM